MHVKAIINFQLISFSVWRLRIDDIKDIADETNNSGCLIGVSQNNDLEIEQIYCLNLSNGRKNPSLNGPSDSLQYHDKPSQKGDIIEVIIEFSNDKYRISFSKNEKPLGVAF